MPAFVLSLLIYTSPVFGYFGVGEDVITIRSQVPNDEFAIA